jgi:hypothetical protein
MAENEDRRLAPQPLQDENHFLNKAHLTEVGGISRTFELDPSWESLSELGILAKTSDGIQCGNVICTYKDNIVIIDFGNFRLRNEYIIPISCIKEYDGKCVYLNVPNETNLQPYSY